MEYRALELCRNVCVLLTWSQYLLGIEIIKTHSANRVPYIAFLINAVSCTGFLHYGWVIDDKTTMVLNFVGLIHWFYVVIHMMNEQKEEPTFALVIAMILSFASFFVDKAIIRDMKLEHIFEAMIRIGWAFAIVKHAKRYNLPFAMLVLGIVCTVIRFFHGCYLGDPYMYAPYIVAFVVKFVAICYADEERHRTGQN